MNLLTPGLTTTTVVVQRSLKCKSRARHPSEDSLVGQTICGIIDGSFDAVFILTVKVDDK